MTYNWNTPFEGFPAGSKQGLTMGEALRQVKGAFYERFIVEHTITESATPTSVHDLGQCGIVLIVDDEDTPTSLFVDGGMQFQSPALYRDSGSALLKALSDEHGDYTDLTEDADHPQYVPLAGGDFSGDGLEWTVDNLTGLEVAGEEYNPRSGSVEVTYVQSKKAHVDAAADTYAKHKDDCVTMATAKTAGAFYLGYGKYSNTAHADLSDADGILELSGLDYITIPVTDVGFYRVFPLEHGSTYGLTLVEDGDGQFTGTFMEIH